MSEYIHISVRNLVEFILRSGDIDNRRGGVADKEAMQMGSRIHRKIQNSMGGSYRAEVFMSETFPCFQKQEQEDEEPDFFITVEGRADGIFENENGMVIDEIKGVFSRLDLMEEPVAVHLAQARCYAYIYARQNGLDTISVQMTYANLETEEIRRFMKEYLFRELEEWFSGILNEYKKWAYYEVSWKKIRQASIRNVEFPFEYRRGQRDLAAAVYRTIARKKKLFIQAPTGSGKTLAVIFPAVKAVGEGLGEKIFYLTAKTIARTVAEEGFALLKGKGLHYKTITLTAKEKICKCEEMQCNPDACPYARGHFDRVNDAVFDMITSGETFRREDLEAQAEKWMVCPFELSLDVSLWMDAVICDYNYVFDPRAHLKRFFTEGNKGDHLFLIDEAHNLVERGRDMFSAKLYKEDFLNLKKELKEYTAPDGGKKKKTGKRMVPDRELLLQCAKLSRALDRCNRHMLSLKRECDRYQVMEHVGTFPLALSSLITVMEKLLEESRGTELNEKVLNLYFQVRTFLDICDRLDDCYVIYSQMEADGRFSLRLFCVDPSHNIQECLDKGNSTVYFSATLLPIDYYMSLLSTAKDDYAMYANSCFDSAKKRVLIGTDVSTRYTGRTPEVYRRIAAYIDGMVSSRTGNYLVFFSSYRMMEDVAEHYRSLLPENADMVCQSSNMTEIQREAFLEQFESGRDSSLVGFCVMGSIFGEGIDLKRDRLIGAVVVGCGLPQVCIERELLKQYYDAHRGDGFRYAYLCPGMNKVLQAAGRVIRTEEDKGVILLLDERFTGYQYRQLFPREWDDCRICSSGDAAEKIRDFWEHICSN